MLFIVIQARMTSTRLPGKIMLPLCHKPVLQIMLERLASFHQNIIIATTNDGSEQPIVDLCQKMGVKFFRGDTHNVLERYYFAATQFKAQSKDVIVRLTSDCPLIDPDITQSTIDYYRKNSFDYVGAGTGSGFPRGMDTEVFSYELLKEAYQNARQDYEKEHVTPYIYKTRGKYLKLGQYSNINNHSKYRLTLDEESDYQAIQAVYSELDCRTNFVYDELIEVLEKNPYIYDLNAAVEQKKITDAKN
ncbi:MAG: NTP transferase domain-containing protein [Gammaproteobacteria bacterium]|nr:NTP transferase domain-containing protein [Gammaproteobacteria bacterium]